MPGPLYLIQRNERRNGSSATSRNSFQGPIELLVVHEFSRQKQKQHEPLNSNVIREHSESGRSRLSSIDSIFSTSSNITSIDTSNTATISPVTVLAEIHYKPIRDHGEEATDSKMWQCLKHGTELTRCDAFVPPGKRALCEGDTCTCYDWIEGRGRETADGL